ncbi:hypothetical protein GCM10028819_48800 [Spirosoma humi]
MHVFFATQTEAANDRPNSGPATGGQNRAMYVSKSQTLFKVSYGAEIHVAIVEVFPGHSPDKGIV